MRIVDGHRVTKDTEMLLEILRHAYAGGHGHRDPARSAQELRASIRVSLRRQRAWQKRARRAGRFDSVALIERHCSKLLAGSRRIRRLSLRYGWAT